MKKWPIVSYVPGLFRYFGKNLFLYIPCMIVSLFFRPALGYLNGLLLGGLMESAVENSMNPVLSRLPIVLSLLLGMAVLQMLTGYGKDISIEKAGMTLRERLLEHITRLPVFTMQGTHSGNYLAQFTMDSGAAVQACDRVLNLIGMLGVSNLASVVYVFSCSPVLGWITLGVALMSFVFNGI